MKTQPQPISRNGGPAHDAPIDVVILAGGLGTRLRSVVPDKPKVLAPVNGRPFLDLLLEKIFSYGLGGNIILCVGYLREQVIGHIAERAKEDARYRDVLFSEEEEPLGTGGAIKQAAALVRGDDFLVLNGDTMTDVNLLSLARFHKDHGSAVTIAVVPNTGLENNGKMDLDDSGKLLDFKEKSTESAGFMNTGVYAMGRAAVAAMPDGPFSVENDFFPRAIAELACYGFVNSADVHDIGTPDRYRAAQSKFSS